MTPAFIDTEAWFALADARSATHEKTAEAISRHSDALLTTSFVFAELIALIVSRKGHQLAARIGERIRTNPHVLLVHPDDRQLARAWQRFVERPDKTYSLTDCLSFVIIEEMKVDVVISNDRHFRQEGFTVLPEPS